MGSEQPTKRWPFRILIAGLSGVAVHWTLMCVKARMGWLPSFQPYENLQAFLSRLTGTNVHPAAPWLLSFLSGATILGFAFGRLYRRLPGNSGGMKGISFGVLAWMVMGLVLFPLLEMGVFAHRMGLGIAPALFSLAMLLTYSVAMGAVYEALGE